MKVCRRRRRRLIATPLFYSLPWFALPTITEGAQVGHFRYCAHSENLWYFVCNPNPAWLLKEISGFMIQIFYLENNEMVKVSKELEKWLKPSVIDQNEATANAPSL